MHTKYVSPYFGARMRKSSHDHWTFLIKISKCKMWKIHQVQLRCLQAMMSRNSDGCDVNATQVEAESDYPLANVGQSLLVFYWWTSTTILTSVACNIGSLSARCRHHRRHHHCRYGPYCRAETTLPELAPLSHTSSHDAHWSPLDSANQPTSRGHCCNARKVATFGKQ